MISNKNYNYELNRSLILSMTTMNRRPSPVWAGSLEQNNATYIESTSTSMSVCLSVEAAAMQQFSLDDSLTNQ